MQSPNLQGHITDLQWIEYRVIWIRSGGLSLRARFSRASVPLPSRVFTCLVQMPSSLVYTYFSVSLTGNYFSELQTGLSNIGGPYKWLQVIDLVRPASPAHRVCSPDKISLIITSRYSRLWQVYRVAQSIILCLACQSRNQNLFNKQKLTIIACTQLSWELRMRSSANQTPTGFDYSAYLLLFDAKEKPCCWRELMNSMEVNGV